MTDDQYDEKRFWTEMVYWSVSLCFQRYFVIRVISYSIGIYILILFFSISNSMIALINFWKKTNKCKQIYKYNINSYSGRFSNGENKLIVYYLKS